VAVGFASPGPAVANKKAPSWLGKGACKGLCGYFACISAKISS